jgi:hypothetical protein
MGVLGMLVSACFAGGFAVASCHSRIQRPSQGKKPQYSSIQGSGNRLGQGVADWSLLSSIGRAAGGNVGVGRCGLLVQLWQSLLLGLGVLRVRGLFGCGCGYCGGTACVTWGGRSWIVEIRIADCTAGCSVVALALLARSLWDLTTLFPVRCSSALVVAGSFVGGQRGGRAVAIRWPSKDNGTVTRTLVSRMVVLR